MHMYVYVYVCSSLEGGSCFGVSEPQESACCNKGKDAAVPDHTATATAGTHMYMCIYIRMCTYSVLLSPGESHKHCSL